MTNRGLKRSFIYHLKQYGIEDSKAKELASKFVKRAESALPKPEPDVLIRHKGETVSIVLDKPLKSKAKRVFESFKGLQGLKGTWERQAEIKNDTETDRYIFTWEKSLKRKKKKSETTQQNTGSKSKPKTKKPSSMQELWDSLDPEERKAILEDVMK